MATSWLGRVVARLASEIRPGGMDAQDLWIGGLGGDPPYLGACHGYACVVESELAADDMLFRVW